MPLGKNVRYRWKTYPSGKKVRLAFKDGKVIEVKPKGGKARLIGRASSSTKMTVDSLASKALKQIRG